jgi:capsular exopolysaccharide synthesis family protein
MRPTRITQLEEEFDRPDQADADLLPSIPARDDCGEFVIAEQLISLRAPGSFAADQYRTLRHSVERLHRNAGLHVVAVTSSKPGDGKSVTALNLAGALAQAREARVLIIDADLRRPSVGEYLGLGTHSAPGLAEAILQPGRSLAQIVKRLQGFNLWVLPAGTPHSAPYELLNSPTLDALLADARKLFDYVIVDTPPLLPFPDSRILSRVVDGYLVIVAAHRTPRKLLIEGVSLLDPAKVIGVVFNGDDQHRSSHYGYYSYYSPQGRDRHRAW